MPLYSYRGLDKKTGKTVRGEVDAESSKGARTRLRKQGIYITDISEKTVKERKGSSVGNFFKRIRIRDISIMTTQLATLEKANIPLVEGLDALCNQVENEKLRLIMTDVRERVNEGSSLADALSSYPRVFSNLYTNMVKAGESSGTLPIVLTRLADLLEYQVKLRAKIIGAITYPVIMIIIGTCLLGFLFISLVPKIISIFEEIGQELPLITKIVIGISHTLQSYWYIIIATLLFMAFMIRRWKSTEKGRFKWDSLMLKLPILGKVIRMISISRFTRTLSTLLSGGVPMLVALDIVKNIVQNRLIFDAIAAARESISEGQSIAKPLADSGQFPPLVTHMIAVGEKTGEIEHMLETVSNAYDVQVDTTITQLTSLLEPFMIVFMGGIVATVVVAMILPILQMNLG